MNAQAKLSSNHPWDRAAATVLTRMSRASGCLEPVDVGANFFVLALEALGAVTRFSCEGHPTGFYVCFDAPYDLALEIERVGYFSVEIEGPNYWSIRKMRLERAESPYTEAKKAETLRWAADAWIRAFGARLAGLDCLKDATTVV